MKTFIRMSGVFILALSLGVLLAPRALSMALMTANAVQDQIQTFAQQMQTSMDAAAPGVAVHVATVLIAVGAVIAASFIYLLVFVPLRIHSMHSEMRRQREEIQAMKSEIHLSSELLMDARRDYQTHEGSGAGAEAARSRLHQWVVPRNGGKQIKEVAHP